MVVENRPASTEDASFRLMGLVWAVAPQDEIDAAIRDILAMQKPDGGWGQLRDYASDAYSTGEALFSLNEGRMSIQLAAWKAGLKFLLSTQAADGPGTCARACFHLLKSVRNILLRGSRTPRMSSYPMREAAGP